MEFGLLGHYCVVQSMKVVLGSDQPRWFVNLLLLSCTGGGALARIKCRPNFSLISTYWGFVSLRCLNVAYWGRVYDLGDPQDRG